VKKLLSNLKFTWKYAKGQKKYLIIFMIANMINILFSIITPILSAKVIIELTTNNYLQIIFISLMILFVNLIVNTMHYIIRRCSIKIYANTLSLLEVDLGKNILKIENECLDTKGSGLFIQRLTNDTSRLADIFGFLIERISNIIKCIGILVAILIVNKIVFIYILMTLIILYIFESIRTTKRNKNDKMVRKAKEKVTGFIGELVRGAKDIKMLNSEDDFINELDTIIKDEFSKRIKMQKNSLNYTYIGWELDNIFSFILICLLVLLIYDGIIVPAIALVLYNYSNNIGYSMTLIGEILENIKDFNLSSERVIDVINSEKFKKEQFGNIHLNKVHGDFEFKNVKFSYKDKEVFKKLNFKINANETVAFVGKSGAGKTTIFNLLCKMYNISDGEITIDGINISKLDKDSIRGNITIISQNPYIFNMSIKDNLRLVKSNLTDLEMEMACKVACLDEFINELPDKYDTIIGEGGVNLSGGQKQRLAIARALVQKTEIILFDEATSALDNETQLKIQKAIENMKEEYTILIIAHRLSTIISADRILFLDNGKIIAEGNHKELLNNCLEYKNLYETEIIK